MSPASLDHLAGYFESAEHRAERSSLPILVELGDRYQRERPFDGETVAVSHLLVRNSMVMVEALSLGGALVVFSDANQSPAEAPIRASLDALGIQVHPLESAVERSDVYLDVGAVLAKVRPPRMAAEVTRTGVLHYQEMDVPVVSADNARSKLIEGFFGTGAGFLEAWSQLRPGSPLTGKRCVQFGFGKIGRGVAHRCRAAGVEVQVVDRSQAARDRAVAEGFQSRDSSPTAELQAWLAEATVVIAVTGVPGSVGSSVPAEWLRQAGDLVNLGAEDEYGPAFSDDEIVGGKAIPLNHHLPRPTPNRYIDAPLAAHLLALEALLSQPDAYGPGVHPLPAQMDRWVIHRWRHHHPDEDLTGIGDELGL